jgi:hypothetical protein
MKAVFFESEGGWLHRCMFAGLDAEGRANWVIIDPCEKPQTIREWEDEYGLGELDLRLLCIEGEVADSLSIVKMLGLSIENNIHMGESLKERMDKLKSLGVTWNHELVDLEFEIMTNAMGKYYYVIDFDNPGCLLGKSDRFNTIHEMLLDLKYFLTVVVMQAGIFVLTSITVDDKVGPKLKKADKDLLLEITRI